LTAPNNKNGFCPVEQNVLQLREAYCRALLRQQPGSVLDVGCGGGEVMGMLMEQGAACTGVEKFAPEQTYIDVPFAQASAEALPFADASFDWVSMRHIPHHLADPARAFAEALRVARHGLLIAEPFFDRALPEQALAEDVDLWMKRQHRRRGMVHDPNHSLHAVQAMLAPLSYRVSWSHHSPPTGNRDGSQLIVQILEESAQLPSKHPDLAKGEELIQRLRQLPVSWNGSLCMVVAHNTLDG
jgi:SAM-dependent methyltransferase